LRGSVPNPAINYPYLGEAPGLLRAQQNNNKGLVLSWSGQHSRAARISVVNCF